MSDKFEQWFESEFPDADLSQRETLKGYNNLKYGWNAALSSLQGEQAAKIAELESRIKELEQQLEVARSDINELGNAYILMRGALNYLTDKSITGNQADEALASKIPDVMQRFPMKQMSGSWENLMTLFVNRDAAKRASNEKKGGAV